MTNIDLSHFKELYLTTARQYLTAMKKHIAVLVEDTHNEASITEVHISAHSLKSQSLVMQHQSIGMLCALIEKIFREAKEKELPLSSEVLIAIQDAILMMESSLNHIEKENSEVDLSYETQNIETLSGIKV
jgi:chemotaxis protein histidine kinase CheA